MRPSFKESDGKGSRLDRAGAARGQGGIETLFLTGVMATVFLIIVLISYQAQLDTDVLSARLEAQRVCHELSFKISTIDSAGQGTSSSLGMPERIAGSDYMAFVSAPDRSISISYSKGIAGCRLPISSVTNGTGAGSSDRFYINSRGNGTLLNIGQGVAIG